MSALPDFEDDPPGCGIEGWSAARLAPLVEPLGYRLHTAIGEAGGDPGGVTAVVAVSLGDVRSISDTASPFAPGPG
ncbi:hypothetical protein GCM10009609_18920 [Pseudonocardia aurantiaca]|uniref:Uncharacterized protein n=1 Tax=Pseudonocardia aurantiaca TaxID=75290 RepID=A0ABW4FNV4_9PSEU